MEKQEAFFIWKKQQITDCWYLIKFVGTISITLTGMVFCFVLAPTMGRYAWNLQNILTHVVVPIAAVVDFFVVSEKRYEVPFLMLKEGIFLCNGMKKNKTLQKYCSVIQYYYAQYT